ncbi:reverse transcriptase [Elysia marginata]|uniref:Reverse transcriptase n=1 Tax=Elysia marginata TaxID=1093978 RepID=A0AAV4F617_9GAST|nr:reverse transcriptase [Elysia marginata]
MEKNCAEKLILASKIKIENCSRMTLISSVNRWTEYIVEDLFNDERPEKPSIDVSDNLVETTTSEVVKAISDLARNKSPGEDEIPAELLQALGTSGKEEITTLINDIYIYTRRE